MIDWQNFIEDNGLVPSDTNHLMRKSGLEKVVNKTNSSLKTFSSNKYELKLYTAANGFINWVKIEIIPEKLNENAILSQQLKFALTDTDLKDWENILTIAQIGSVQKNEVDFADGPLKKFFTHMVLDVLYNPIKVFEALDKQIDVIKNSEGSDISVQGLLRIFSENYANEVSSSAVNIINLIEPNTRNVMMTKKSMSFLSKDDERNLRYDNELLSHLGKSKELEIMLLTSLKDLSSRFLVENVYETNFNKVNDAFDKSFNKVNSFDVDITDFVNLQLVFNMMLYSNSANTKNINRLKAKEKFNLVFEDVSKERGFNTEDKDMFFNSLVKKCPVVNQEMIDDLKKDAIYSNSMIKKFIK